MGCGERLGPSTTCHPPREGTPLSPGGLLRSGAMDSSPPDPAPVTPKPSCGMGNCSLILPPCRGPSQAIVWIFLGILQRSSRTWPPCFAKCFPRIFLLCLPLQKEKKAFISSILFYFFLICVYKYLASAGHSGCAQVPVAGSGTGISPGCIWEPKSRLHHSGCGATTAGKDGSCPEELQLNPEGLLAGDERQKPHCPSAMRLVCPFQGLRSRKTNSACGGKGVATESLQLLLRIYK